MGHPHQLAQFTPSSPELPGVVQEGIESRLSGTAMSRGVYVHVPFCRHRCHYCDFFTLAGREDAMDAFLDRIEGEIKVATNHLQGPIETMFIGGGTPTLLPAGHLERLLGALRGLVEVGTDCEWTVEANPETVTEEIAGVLADGGVNRVSLGAQSFDPASLKALERQHDPSSVPRSLDRLRAAGIDRLSLDLIFAIPGQDLQGWIADLQQAIGLGVEHLSCYGLIYEKGTPLTRRRDRGLVQQVDEDIEAEMYTSAMEELASNGYEHYEISNWSKPGAACRHNLLYWRNENWWPIGPGASGHVEGLRWKNLPRLGPYIEGTGLPAVTGIEQLDEDGRIGEAFMLGLRMLEGIEQEQVDSLLAGGTRGGVRRDGIERHMRAGLLEHASGRLRLSGPGLLVADSVMADLL